MNEMNALIKLLATAYIPFEVRIIEIALGEQASSLQVCVPSADNCVTDAICHDFSYGGPKGLLEVMFDGEMMKAEDDVVGYLTARGAFELMRKAYNMEVARGRA